MERGVFKNQFVGEESDEESDELEPLIISSEPNEHLSETLKVKAEQVIQFFQHPSKSFAQSQLNLNLSNRSIVLEDVEPFSINQLDSYLMRQAFLETQLAKEQDVNVEETKAARIDNVTTEATLSGHFPDLPTTPQVFERWLDDSQDFADEIKDKGMANPELIPQKLLLSIDQGNAQSVQIELSVSMPLIQEQQVFYRSSSAKSKDKFMLYLHQLILQCLQQEQGNNTDQKIPAKSQAEIMELETTRLEAKLFDTKQTCGFYFDTKAQKVSQLVVQYIPDPKVKLEKLMSLYLQGNNRALLLNSDLADKCFKSKKFEQAEFEAYWHDTNSFMPFGEDPYIRYFWPKCPAFETIESLLTEIYQPLYDAILPVKKGKKVVVAKAVTKAVEKGAS